MPTSRWTLAALLLAASTAFSQSEELARTIREEALRSVHDPEGRPLPLAGHWHTGTTVKGYGPAYQKRQLEAGRRLLPWFIMPSVGDDQIRNAYYEEPIRRAARLKLPIVFIGTQWERLLATDKRFFHRPAENNPNVIRLDGSIERKVSPFGPVEAWREAGRLWGEHPALAKMQEWYPDPPLVVFLSNNEQPKLRWTELEQSRAYAQRFGQGQSDAEKRRLVAEGWKERYPALFEGIRDGLVSAEWKRNSIFVGYNAFAPGFLGRWPGWPAHSLHHGRTLSPWAEIWNGASMPYYTNPWDGSTDCNVWSPQVEAENWVAALESLPSDREFWFELSTWDGATPGKPNDKRAQYARAGQSYGPERYGGFVQYGMWLTRPRVVREFRAHNETLEPTEPYFLQVMDAVDRVHKTPELAEFWRRGRLAANTDRDHPYQTIVPDALAGARRWHRLDTNLDPKGPWKLHSELYVFALALEMGDRPNRRWLLYAHAPLGTRSGVDVKIPGYGTATIDVPVAGDFWVVDETSRSVRRVAAGG